MIASTLFDKEDLEKIRKLVEETNGKIVAVYDTPRNPEHVKTVLRRVMEKVEKKRLMTV